MLNLRAKGYFAESLRVVLFHLWFSLSTLTISPNLSLFISLFLLMIIRMSNSCFNVLQTTGDLELLYVKLTTGWEPTSFS